MAVLIWVAFIDFAVHLAQLPWMLKEVRITTAKCSISIVPCRSIGQDCCASGTTATDAREGLHVSGKAAFLSLQRTVGASAFWLIFASYSYQISVDV